MKNYMRTAIVAGLLAWAVPAMAFDPSSSISDDTSPMQAFRVGHKAYMTGNVNKALDALQFAAKKGNPLAQWKLGRMYADGDGVDEDDRKAFDYFSRIASTHAAQNPMAQNSRIVSNSFVALGTYYLSGIPNSDIKADNTRARRMFTYAASYFGDPDAQYKLARMYLLGAGGSKSPRLAVRWLRLAALKGHTPSQATLGELLFFGERIKARPARGLMWLMIARDKTKGRPEARNIRKVQEKAFAFADEKTRRHAVRLAKQWQTRHAAVK